jgi:hypothetical protein
MENRSRPDLCGSKDLIDVVAFEKQRNPIGRSRAKSIRPAYQTSKVSGSYHSLTKVISPCIDSYVGSHAAADVFLASLS